MGLKYGIENMGVHWPPTRVREVIFRFGFGVIGLSRKLI